MKRVARTGLLRLIRPAWPCTLLVAFAAANVDAAELLAQAILDKSQAAMMPPIQYRVRTDGVEILVSQKKLSDGSLAMRAEATAPVAKISLLLGDQSYEMYPDQGAAIDTKFMYQASKKQAATIAASLGARPANTAAIIGTVERDGKDCFVVETTISGDALAAFDKLLPAEHRAMIPRGDRLFVEKSTYLLVALESLSRTGAILSKSEFKDVSPNADLPDDLFLLPDGVEFLKPASIEEYMQLLLEILKPQSLGLASRANPRVPPVSPVMRAPVMGRVQFDPKTGRAIAAVPPGMTKPEFDRVISEKVADITAATKRDPEPPGMSAARMAGIAISLLTTVVFLGVVVQRRLSKARKNAHLAAKVKLGRR